MTSGMTLKTKKKKEGARGESKKVDGKQENIFKFFCKPSEKGSHTRKRKSEEDSENIHQDNHEKRAKNIVEEKGSKKLKSIESDCFQQKDYKINEDTISEKTESKDRTSIQFDIGESGEYSVYKKEIFSQFKKVFSDITESQIHNYYFCTENNCNDICSKDLASMKKDNKFQHKWLFDPNIARCDKSHKWCLVYIDGKGMFCSLCRTYDIKQNNGMKTWNAVGNVRCRQQTVVDHFNKDTSMHQEAVRAYRRQKSSYFDREAEKKTTNLKNDVYFKVFSSLYWLAKEEMPTSKMTSLLTLLENMGVHEIKYFETRSEPVLRKMLLLIAKTIIQDLVDKIKESDVYALLTDEVTDISNVCQLVSFVKIFDVDKGKAETAFLDCSDLLEHSPEASPNADAIVTCITKKFEELGMEIKKLKAFVSDGASVMTGVKGGVATKLREEFSKSMINIHCICHRLALACADTGDDYKFIRSFEQNLIELWKFFKNSSKRLKIYIRIALKSKEFDTMNNNRQKKIVKKVKKSLQNSLVKPSCRC